MSRKIGMVMLGMILSAAVFSVFADGTLAQEDAAKDEKTVATPPPPAAGWTKAFAVVGACIGAGMSAIGGGYAIARIGSTMMEAVARQPEAAGQMFAPMIVTAAMIEGGMLFAIVVCLLGVLQA